MATLHITAPDGKKLAVNVPEGTDPSQYDAMAEEAVEHYKSSNPENGLEFERSANYPNAMATTGSPSLDIAMGVEAAPKLAMAAPKLVRALPTAAKAIGEGLGDIGGTVAKAGEAVGDMFETGKNWITNNTPRGFGFSQAAGATPEARAAAKEAIEFANKAHPELGELAARAESQGPGLVPYGTEMPAPSGAADAFNSPVRAGMTSAPEEMLQTAQTQRDYVGRAIQNTLSKYDNTGTFFNPAEFNNQVKGMLLRDVDGEVMTTGAQGQINEAIKEAASSLNDFSKNGPIKWSDAARVKTMMQGNGRWGEAGLTRAQEAYNTVTTMLKENIDNQAAEMLGKNGGNVQEYQALRQAYGKLDTLADSLNVAAKRKFANNPIPWWLKMTAGAFIGSGALGIVKGLTGH